MEVPKIDTLDYFEQQMQKAKFIRDALQNKITKELQSPTFEPSSDKLYFYARVMEGAERDYDFAEKEFEAKHNEFYPNDKENRRNEDY